MLDNDDIVGNVADAFGVEYEQVGPTDEGTRCPCCDAYLKIYKRKINSTMARNLIAMYKLTIRTGATWMHATEIGKEASIKKKGKVPYPGMDIGHLQHWGLVAKASHQDGVNYRGGRTSGYWRITQKGKDYVCNKMTLPKYKHEFRQVVIRDSGDWVTIVDCLGEQFDYAELMS